MTHVDVVLWIGTAALFCALPLAVWFTFDYGVITPIRRLRAERGATLEERQYLPWWRNGIGIMWFGYGATISILIATVVLARVLSSFYGLNWPGREWITLVSYLLVLGLVILSTVVYAVEKTHPGLILVPKARRRIEAERAARLPR